MSFHFWVSSVMMVRITPTPKGVAELLTRLDVEEGEGEAIEVAGDKCPF
jgi:hypothetical protein